MAKDHKCSCPVFLVEEGEDVVKNGGDYDVWDAGGREVEGFRAFETGGSGCVDVDEAFAIVFFYEKYLTLVG